MLVIGCHWGQAVLRLCEKGMVLPIRLCDIDSLKRWECFDADFGRDIAVEIREYSIPDFSDWNKPPKNLSQASKFETSFSKLCRDLRREGVQTNKRKFVNK